MGRERERQKERERQRQRQRQRQSQRHRKIQKASDGKTEPHTYTLHTDRQK